MHDYVEKRRKKKGGNGHECNFYIGMEWDGRERGWTAQTEKGRRKERNERRMHARELYVLDDGM
jgi:hypothetical protein